MANIKFRFIKMMKKWAPMKKSALTSRALAQLRINMATLDDLIAECSDDELIGVRKFPDTGKGRVPQIYFLTAAGKDWLKLQIKEQKRQIRGLK